MLRLSETDRSWVQKKWMKIRLAQQEADKANSEWKAINEALSAKFAAEGITDIVQLNRLKNESIPLKDALATGDWHSRNAERHIHDLNLFLRLRELEIV